MCFINTKYKKQLLLSISLFLSAVMMFFFFYSADTVNLLHPSRLNRREEDGIPSTERKPIFNYTKTPSTSVFALVRLFSPVRVCVLVKRKGLL